MADEKEREWNLILEEYKSLREEIIEKMERQYQIVGLGVGGVSLLLGFAFESKYYALFWFLPLIIISCMILFSTERTAIQNVGNYIRSLEKKFIKDEEIGWERWLTSDKNRLKTYDHNEISSLFILYILYMISVFGIAAYASAPLAQNWIKNTIIAIYIIISICIIIKCISRWRCPCKELM